MKINELKNGDIVVLRTGHMAAVIKGDDDWLLYQHGGADMLMDYDEDMIYLDNEDAIMQVYRGCYIGFDTCMDDAPIYERDDTWTRPTAEEMAAAEEEARIRREAAEAERCAQAEIRRQEEKLHCIDIITQQFYGNRTGHRIRRDHADYFLRGILDPTLPGERADDVEREYIRVPGAEHIVIVYDRKQEEEYVNVEFPHTYAKYGAEYRENYGEEMQMTVSCDIPEAGIQLHTRCFACRIDEDGVLQSLQSGDVDKFIRYFPAR